MENEPQPAEQATVTANPETATYDPASTEIPLRARRAKFEQDEEEYEGRGRLKKILFVLFILILLLLGLLYLAGLRKAPAPPPPQVKPISFSGPWSDIATYEGDKNGVRTTPAFTITGTMWRVIWSSRPVSEESELDNSVVFFIRPKKAYANPSDNVVVVGTANDPRSATWNIRSHAGEYYFQILARNADWNIKVQQMVTAAPTK